MTTGCNALDVRFLNRPNIKECWMCSRENHAEGVGILKQVFDVLNRDKLDAVSVRLFGDRKSVTEAKILWDTEAEKAACPPLLIVQESLAGQDTLHVQVYAVSAGQSVPLYHEGALVGRVIEDEHAACYMLRVLPEDDAVHPHEQTRSVFEKAHAILSDCGGGFSDTVRTWLFADDILSWYDQLNKARNQFFEQHDIYHKLVPASTGVGTANVHGKHLAAQLLAVISKNGAVRAYSVDSPLQCPALDYKSSFSRAVQLDSPDHSRLYISGTAAIDREGKTVLVGDPAAQLELTMQVVQALLERAGMDWSNATGSLVYFKDYRNFGLFDAYCRRRNIRLPHIKIQADVCRDDLLFEIELDAIRSISHTCTFS
jgi:enamine deaminase RidA (YjgF/YER057c/UK114 family)